VIMVFFGKARWNDRHDEHHAHGDLHPHESPVTMVLPLVLLAGAAVVAGIIQLPFSNATKLLEQWLEPVIHYGEHHLSESAEDLTYVLMGVAIVVAAVGIFLGWAVYSRHKLKAVEPQILAKGWYYDSTVSAFMGGPGRESFELLAEFDAGIVDGAVNGAGHVVTAAAKETRKVQTGNVRTYAAGITVGVVLLLGWFVIVKGVL
jgi:NADH-quinone oxidoreductase subunit L